MPQPARRRTPLPVRIAIWRRRVVVGSIGVFVAAWLAVAGLGRQAASDASAGTATTHSSESPSPSSQDLSSATTSQS
jgi:hypothetical protein